MKIFGREPALVLAFVAGAIQVISAFLLPLSDEVQGALNAVAVAGVGLWTAIKVAEDKLVPAILGFVQAGLALALAFGLELSAEDQSTLMAFVAVAVGMFTRTQVVAPLARDGARTVPAGRHSVADSGDTH